MAISIERKRKVVMGKIHISPWVKDEFEERLIKLFKSGEEYIPLGGEGVSKFIWVFGDPLVKQLDGETVLFARLGKINKDLYEIAFDRNKITFKKVKRVEPTAQNYSNFIIHPKSNSILFEERMPNISINQFKESFTKIYVNYFDDFSSVNIGLAGKDMKRVYDILKEYEKITEVMVKVSPPNPRDQEYERLEFLLNESNTDEGIFKFKNKEKGLKVKDTIIGEGVALSNAGYGEDYTISGIREGKEAIIRSKDQRLIHVVKTSDEPEDLVVRYWNTLKELSERRGKKL